MKGADVLISLSTPGPDSVKREWIRVMAEKSIVLFVLILFLKFIPMLLKKREPLLLLLVAVIFPNQVNNSIGFPGILKGALMVRASKITDNMAIAAAHSLAKYAEKEGYSS